MDVRSAFRRRIVSVPTVVLLAFVLWGLAPLWFAIVGVVDVFRWLFGRRPFVGIRLLAMGLVYSAAELIGVAACGASWVRCRWSGDDGCVEADAFAIQLWWAEFLFQSMSALLGLNYRVEGTDAVAEGPFILLSRHVSIIDTLLPTHFVARPHHRHIRYVLKDELLVDPALDIAGNRLPNVFVQRGSGSSDAEAERIRALAASMPDDEAVLIFPEGTRFTEAKRDRFVASLAERDPALHARAAEWRHVLPPKQAGTLALLDGSDADVVVLAHRGLEGLALLADIWAGEPVGRTVDIQFRRIPRAAVPDSESERTAWLADTWEALDHWVGGSGTIGAD